MTQKCITHTISLSTNGEYFYQFYLRWVWGGFFMLVFMSSVWLSVVRLWLCLQTTAVCRRLPFLSVIPVIIVCFLCSVQPGFTLCLSVGCLVYLTVCPSVCRLFSLCFICLPPFSHVLFLYVWAYLWIVFLALKFAVECEALPPLPLALRIWYNAAMYWLLFFSCSVHFFAKDVSFSLHSHIRT